MNGASVGKVQKDALIRLLDLRQHPATRREQNGCQTSRASWAVVTEGRNLQREEGVQRREEMGMKRGWEARSHTAAARENGNVSRAWTFNKHVKSRVVPCGSRR